MKIEGFAPAVQSEYDRVRKLVGPDDPYLSELTLGIHDILRAHFLIADHFYSLGFGIGGIGPKDVDLLHSAVHRQFTGFGSKRKWETKFEIAATLMFGLVMDHPFHDANKRTAFLSTLYLLQKRGRWPTIAKEEFEKFTVEIAERGIEKRRRYKQLIKDGSLDPEVEFIAKYLKQNPRDIDKREYFITYRELENLLNERGFHFRNPFRNHIEIWKTENKMRGFLNRRVVPVETRIGTIGYPGASRELAKGDLRRIRKMLNLTDEDGVDSQSFYRGVDDLRVLIDIYDEPLRRLADK